MQMMFAESLSCSSSPRTVSRSVDVRGMRSWTTWRREPSQPTEGEQTQRSGESLNHVTFWLQFDCRRTPHSFRFHFLLHWRRYCRSWQQYLRWCPFLLPHLSLPLSFFISSSPTCLPIFLLSFLYLPPSLPSSPPPSLPYLPISLPFLPSSAITPPLSSYQCFTSSPPLRATTSGSQCKPNWFLTTTMSSSFPWTSRPWKM